MNTQFRQKANNKFEVTVSKLMNNNFFGKTCEDVRKYNDVKIVTNEGEIEIFQRGKISKDGPYMMRAWLPFLWRKHQLH